MISGLLAATRHPLLTAAQVAYALYLVFGEDD